MSNDPAPMLQCFAKSATFHVWNGIRSVPLTN